MPQQFKSPPAALCETPPDGTTYGRQALAHTMAEEPHDGYHSPLVDALLEQLRQARARRQAPH